MGLVRMRWPAPVISKGAYRAARRPGRNHSNVRKVALLLTPPSHSRARQLRERGRGTGLLLVSVAYIQPCHGLCHFALLSIPCLCSLSQRSHICGPALACYVTLAGLCSGASAHLWKEWQAGFLRSPSCNWLKLLPRARLCRQGSGMKSSMQQMS